MFKLAAGMSQETFFDGVHERSVEKRQPVLWNSDLDDDEEECDAHSWKHWNSGVSARDAAKRSGRCVA